MRENVSSIKTKKHMAKALEQILNDKPIEKITVSEITDICGVNRQTFYYHFNDIYDLAKWLLTGYAQKLIGDNIEYNNWHEAFLATARFLKQKKKILIIMVNSVGHYLLKDFIIKTIRPYIKTFILSKSEGKNISDRYTDFLSDYYTVSFSALLLEWIITDADQNSTPEELLDLLILTIEGNADSAIERYRKAEAPSH